MRKGLDERIDEGVLGWFSHVERIERDRIAKRTYVRECAGSHRQARRMVQDGSEWQGFVRGDEPLTLMRCHSCGLPQLYEAFEGWKSICD